MFRSAADATGCEVKLTWDQWPYLDVANNTVLMDLYSKAMTEAGYSDMNPGVKEPDAHTGSTDFGSVSYNIPSIHPSFGIHTEHHCHTAGFAEAAGQNIAFDDALVTAKALVATGLNVLEDEQVYGSILSEFKKLQQ